MCWGALCAWAALGLWRPGHPGLEDCVPPCTRPSLTRPSPLSAPAAGCWAGLALPRVRSRWQEAGSRHAFWARQGGAEGVGELGPQLGGGRCGPPGAASGAPSALGGAGVSDSGGSQTTRAWLCVGGSKPCTASLLPPEGLPTPVSRRWTREKRCHSRGDRGLGGPWSGGPVVWGSCGLGDRGLEVLWSGGTVAWGSCGLGSSVLGVQWSVGPVVWGDCGM